MRLVSITFLAIFGLILLYPVGRWLLTPHGSWVERVATFETGAYDLSEFNFHDADVRNFREYPALEKANQQKRKWLSIYRSGRGRYGLLRRSSGAEGDATYTWLMVDDGNVTVVRDRTRHGVAFAFAVDRYHPKAIQVGFTRKDKFVEGDPTAADSSIIVIQLDLEKSGKVKFF